MLIMTPEEIQGDYACTLHVQDYRINKKAEFKVVVHISFYSSRTHSVGSTSWHIWRGFTAFRKLDEQLRKRNAAHLKGIKFPPLYRRRSIFRANLSTEFLERRMRELDNYLTMLTRSPQLVAFHVLSVQSQTMKAFVGFTNGFGSNPQYDEQDSVLRPSMSVLAPPQIAAMRDTASVMGDDDDDFRSVSSSSTFTSVASSNYSSTTPQHGDYRWSGTGFVGSASFARPNSGNAQPLMTPSGSFSTRSSSARGSWFPMTESIVEHVTTPSGGMRPSVSMARNSTMMSMTPSNVITPELDQQRAKMEEQLLKCDLLGVGMPPDGSCLLHCVVYEMFPLQCLRDYPSTMAVVNVGAADGMAPRRIAASQLLRVKLMDYALEHVELLAAFLMQEVDDLTERYETFRDTPDEQATIAELYAVSSMFNIRIELITNDPSFQIDPVMPVEGLPSVREGAIRTVTFGYMIPAEGVAGHYICTRERRSALAQGGQNSFVGGSYRGSVSIGPPKSLRCSTVGPRRFDRIPEQRVE
jgi:hypothetical protein